MKKILVSIIVGASLFLALFMSPLFLHKAKADNPYGFDFGDGSQYNPYGISTCIQLRAIATNIGSLSTKYFAITQDIDCIATSISDTSDPRYNATLYDNGRGFKQIGYYNYSSYASYGFYGTIDGNNHTISNVTTHATCANTPEQCPGGDVIYTGFIGYGGPTIRNLNLSNVNISGNVIVGGLFGYGFNPTIENVSVTGTVRGDSSVGLLMGGAERSSTGYDSTPKINRVNTSGSVYGRSGVGGIIGQTFGGITINNSYSTANIYTSSQYSENVGGLVGYSKQSWTEPNYETSHILNSYFNGSISTENTGSSIYYAGGIVGKYENGNSIGQLTNVFSVGTISTDASPRGGLIGRFTGGANSTLLNTSYETTGDCVGDGDEMSCHTVTAASLKNTSATAPLSEWNFDTIWNTTTNYPALRSVVLSVPGLPTDMTSTGESDTTWPLSWVAPTDNGNPSLLRYEVQYRPTSTAPSGSWSSASTTDPTHSITLTGLTSETEYEYKVRAINVYGNGDFTDPLTFTTTPTIVTPAAPSFFTITPHTDNGNTVDVSWSGPTPSVTAPVNYYKLQYKRSDYSWDEDWAYTNVNLESDKNSQQNISLSGYNTTYNFRILAGNTAAGDGSWATANYTTPNSPTHHISTCQELQDINDLISEDYDIVYDNFVLDNDIDCASTRDWNGGGGFVPIYDLRGEFDGHNHKITGLYMNYAEGGESIGLWSQIGDEGQIKNLTIENADITGYESVSILAGYSSGDTVYISNVHIINSNLTGDYYTGGFVGYFEGDDISFTDAEFSGTINGGEGTGGIVGYSDESILIDGGVIAGTINSTSMRAGGAIGYANYADLNEVVNSANITGTYRIGGLIGSADAIEIARSSNSGKITASQVEDLGFADFKGVGGLVGMVWEPEISDSYNSGEIDGTGTIYVGGLIGATMDASIQTSYNSGTITGDIIDNDQNGVGGLIGAGVSMSITNCFNDADINGKVRTGGLTGFAYQLNAVNTYNVGQINSLDNTVAGGIIGENTGIGSFFSGEENVTLINSFNTGDVITDPENDGAIAGYIYDYSDLENNWWYNSTEKGVGNYEDLTLTDSYEKASGKNVFKNNQTTKPLDTWNFTSTWCKVPNKYPQLVFASDTTKPVITLLGSRNVKINVGTTYHDAGATATDNHDGNITDQIVITSNVNTKKAGKYTVTYNVTDSWTNAATPVTRNVTVQNVTTSSTSNSQNNSGANNTDDNSGGSDTPEKTILNNYEEYLNGKGKNLSLQKDNIIYLEINGTEYALDITTINNNLVEIKSESTGDTIQIDLNNDNKFDVNGDGIDDLSIRLDSVLGANADISFSKLTQDSASEQNTKSKKSYLPLYLVITIGAITIGFVIYVIRTNKKNEQNSHS